MLNQSDPLEEVRIFLAYCCTAQHITVPTQILGSGVHHQISARVQWALEHGSSPGVIADANRSSIMGNLDDLADVGDFQKRVRWCFHPDKPGVRPHRLLDCSRSAMSTKVASRPQWENTSCKTRAVP